MRAAALLSLIELSEASTSVDALAVLSSPLARCSTRFTAPWNC